MYCLRAAELSCCVLRGGGKRQLQDFAFHVLGEKGELLETGVEQAGVRVEKEVGPETTTAGTRGPVTEIRTVSGQIQDSYVDSLMSLSTSA